MCRGQAATRSRSEDDIQRTVVDMLRIAARPGVFWFHPPNGGGRSRIEAAIMQGLGVRAGVPDLMLLINGRCHALELKAPAGRLSPAQQAMHAEMALAGAVVATAWGVDEALGVLAQWGAIRTSQNAQACTAPKREAST